MLRDLLAGGTTVIPGIGSDIADPDAKENAYDGHAGRSRCCRSWTDGLAPLATSTRRCRCRCCC